MPYDFLHDKLDKVGKVRCQFVKFVKFVNFANAFFLNLYIVLGK